MALEDVGAVVVSTPIRTGQPQQRGPWNEWCAKRRVDAPSGTHWDDPRMVVDLTGPVATVGLRQPRGATDVAGGPAVPARLVTIAAVAIVALNVLDIITTRLALLDGATEGNPLAALFVHNFPLFVTIKLVLPGMVALRMWVIRDRTTPMLLAAMWWVVGVYSMVITINALHVF
jgi:hypothetical protein